MTSRDSSVVAEAADVADVGLRSPARELRPDAAGDATPIMASDDDDDDVENALSSTPAGAAAGADSSRSSSASPLIEGTRKKHAISSDGDSSPASPIPDGLFVV